MAIGLYAKRGKHSYNKYVEFPEKIHLFLYYNKDEFSSHVKILINLDPYGDTVISGDEIKSLMQFCAEVQEIISDKSIKINHAPYAVTKEELQVFINEFSQLLNFAAENEMPVWAYGD